MKYLLFTLIGLLFVTKTIAANEQDIILAQKQLGGLNLEVFLRKGDAAIPSMVCKLTNKSNEDFMHGYGTPALGFVLTAETLDGTLAKYSPNASEMYAPRAYISYVHVPIKAGKSVEYVISAKDIQGLFLAPIKSLRVEWSRGFDPMGNAYPALSGAFVDLDINLIFDKVNQLGKGNFLIP